MTTLPPLDLGNVQGDILEGLGKKHETFLFFRIKAQRVSSFRADLHSFIPLVTDTNEAKKFHETIKAAKEEAAKQGKPCPLLENSGVNISFSQKGLTALGIVDDIGDDVFKKGMVADVANLGDDFTAWDGRFKTGTIHGVIVVTANSPRVLHQTIEKIERIFKVGRADATVEEVVRLAGHTRPGAESGHEHFGFNDGLSQPALQGVDAGVTSEPGQSPIRQGIVLLGRDGDDGVLPPGGQPQGVTRPPWALDGSFLAFRYLKQLVPEFDAFLEAHALKVPFPPAPGDPTGAELLGARLVGRWKSGAPIDLTPLRDDPSLATREDFRFDPSSQERCPYAAHVRKTNPRADLDAFGGTEARRILRRGIAFGPEVTDEEKGQRRTLRERGLLFACYQSNLANGFRFIQQSWANTATFPPKQDTPQPGIDPIIGVGSPRQMVGSSPDAPGQELNFGAEWVVPRGGEYFFSPSLSALKNTFAAAAAASSDRQEL
ncbi:Dyp-type peroxidase [Xylariaceae sp. FL0594]|nr:Dyp-type peroxidase [Xylariaceae sp. FL0594]